VATSGSLVVIREKAASEPLAATKESASEPLAATRKEL
jgi:hypothetical protein